MTEARDLEVAGLLTLMVRVMVDLVADANVIMHSGEDGASFRIAVDAKDRGKVIGPSGRHIRAIRGLVSAIGRRSGRAYLVEIDEEPEVPFPASEPH